jgi:hypothetical protein
VSYKRVGNKVYSKSSGEWKLKQTCKSAASAKGAIRLLQGIKHGMKPRKSK